MNPSQPTGTTLDEILEKYKRSFTGNPGIYKTKAETIAAIQALVEEAIPEKRPDIKKYNEDTFYSRGYNAAIDDLRSRLMRAGLVK